MGIETKPWDRWAFFCPGITTLACPSPHRLPKEALGRRPSAPAEPDETETERGEKQRFTVHLPELAQLPASQVTSPSTPSPTHTAIFTPLP